MATGGQSETLRRFKALAESVLAVTARLEHAAQQVDAGSAAVASCVEQVRQAAERTREREEELAHGYVRATQQMERLDAQLAAQVEAHRAVREEIESYLKVLKAMRRLPLGLTGPLARG